jgi:RNA polymerase-binding transcription factor DksA
MATKKTIKKVATATKPAAKKAIAKPIVKKTAPKQVVKKVAPKPVAPKKVAKPAVKATTTKQKPVAAKPAAKAPVKVAAKSIVKPTAKPVAKKAAVKASVKATTKKEVTKPAPKAVVKTPVKKEKVVKPPKAVKPPKPAKAPKVVKPAPIVLSAKEIAAKKKAIKEALLKELDKKMPDPPPPPVFKRRVEDKNKKPVVIPKVTAKTSQPYKPDFMKSIMDAPKPETSGPLVRYSDTELTEFRDIINKKLEAAKRELSYLQGLITRKDELGGTQEDGHYMTMEDGSMSMEREQLSQMASRQITYIDHLEKAIMRIENKTYGICRVTNKLIDKARLRAVPHATLSIEAKMMQR